MSDQHADGGLDQRLVSTSDIAEIAEVGASAVSNWRKRFATFPRPAGTAHGGGDLFRLDEVEKWLESRGRPRQPERSATDHLGAMADRLRGTVVDGDVGGIVAVAGAFVHLARQRRNFSPGRLQGAQHDVAQWVATTAAELEAARPELDGLFAPLSDVAPQALRALVEALNELDDGERLADCVDLILARNARYAEFRTRPATADLVVALAEPHGRIFDPAAGSGELLLRAAATAPTSTLFGQELNTDTWRIAMSRLLLRDVEGQLAVGDSLADDAFPELLADAVICEPPAGTRMAENQRQPGDPRWQLLGTFDGPPASASEFAWIAHAIHHLAPDGRAYLLLPAGSLFQGGKQGRLRSELLRRGTVEAIIGLPTGTLQHTTAPSALWIVRPPTATPDDVLLIAADDDSAVDAGELSAQVTELVSLWRTQRQDFHPRSGLAGSVPVLDLLAGDASLLPARWLDAPERLDADALVEAVSERHRALEAAHAEIPPAPPEAQLRPRHDPPARVRVGDLVESGRARLIRASRLKPEDYVADGLPVWLPANVHAPWQRDEQPRFADPARVDPRSITEPGDIVMTTIGGLRTRVDLDGGHVLGTSLQALRLAPETLDPRAVAALLTAEPNQRLLTGSTIPRVNIRELEIPVLGHAEAAQLNQILDAIEREQNAAHALVGRTEELREAVIAAVSSGIATPNDSPTRQS